MLPEIRKHLAAGQFSVRGMIEGSAAEIIPEGELIQAGFAVPMFANINTPDDYRKFFSWPSSVPALE